MISQFVEQADFHASLLCEMQNYLAWFTAGVSIPDAGLRGNFSYLHPVPQALAVQAQIEVCLAITSRHSLPLVCAILDAHKVL